MLYVAMSDCILYHQTKEQLLDMQKYQQYADNTLVFLDF